MSAIERKIELTALVEKYKLFKSQGKLDLTSEETIRTWLNELLRIFGWDVQDTSQVLQEKVLSRAEKERLREIGSTNSRPDYTLKIANQKLSFLDAKDISISIENDADAAFQIKSYGWSILAPCAFISNFEELAIYDCTYVPDHGQGVNFGRRYFTIDEFVNHFETLDDHLLRENIISGKLATMYSATFVDNRSVERVTPDVRFAEQLSDFRLLLADDILVNNSELIGSNSESLSYIVQIIINRLLFIRVCEARNIEEEGLLRSFRDAGFWTSFKKSSYFRFFEHYDGPLFDRIALVHDVNISDEVFNGILDLLYYPAPYRFDVIPTKLLSDIYELFLAKKLVVADGVVRDLMKSEYIKTKGAVSTPSFIVSEVVRKTIPKADLMARGISGFLDHKILDIACGSGVFAIEAYDYLEEVFLELFRSGDRVQYAEFFHVEGEEVIVNLQGKRRIMENCIFGVDIDAEAVEVAKMALSLKVIDTADRLDAYEYIGIFGSKILNGIGDNIRCGNSLVESDILTLYPGLADEHDQLLATNIFDWDSEMGFREVFAARGGFDYVIGNPPYVEVKNYNTDLPFMHMYLKGKFPSSSNGKVDLAIPFIERAISLLNPNGRMGFVVQQRFFKADYGKKIREVISQGSLLSAIVDFTANDIFKGRMTYVALLMLDKSAPVEFSYRKFQEETEFLPAKLREDMYSDRSVWLSADGISGGPWSFADSEIIAIRSRLLEYGKLGDYAKVRVGVQVLWDKCYQIKHPRVNGELVSGNSTLENVVEVELDACRPMVCNEHFYPYRKDRADVFIIFPYRVLEGQVFPIPFDEFNERYPLAGAYLSRNRATIEENVETLPVMNPTKYDERSWHLYTRVQNHGATYPKILVPMTALDPIASVSFSDRTYCNNANVFFIDVPGHDSDDIYALSAVINSTVYSVLARSIAMPQAAGYFKFNKQFLEPVPFPVERFLSCSELKKKLANLAEEIEVLQNRYIGGSPNQKRTYSRSLTDLWERLDGLVEELYQLTAEEVILFRSRGRNMSRIECLN